MSAYLYEVIDPITHPVPARTGDILAVRPGHPTRPIVVFRMVAGEWTPVTVGPPNFGALLVREDDGVIQQIFSSFSQPLAAHPALRSA
jgi:hypothetical protein